MRFIALPLIGLLTACSPGSNPDVTDRATPLDMRLPPMKVFNTSTVQQPIRSNATIARDFLDLTFQLESGRAVPRLTRFDGPISVRVGGKPAPPSLMGDLNALLERLRSEAKIPIQLTTRKDANITVEIITRNQLQRTVPNAACFVVPGVSGWADYRKRRGSAIVDWATLTKRTRITVFIPAETSPQEIRDCLHEEIAQGLGPLNDLYRLPDSVFNDDNFHTVLTGFDMLILRAYYDPVLKNGMTQQQVVSVLPGVIQRLNPAGGRGIPARAPQTERAWINAIETALNPTRSPSSRLTSARKALRIAQRNGWADNRLAFSHFIVGRLNMGVANVTSLNNFQDADRFYGSSTTTKLQRAHVGVNLAAFALRSGDGQTAIDLADAYIPSVMRSENAALLSTFLMMKAEGLDQIGRKDEAAEIRLESLGWARYGFGEPREISARLSEIAALSPKSVEQRN
ncbi:DUF2927 domain-containing protein [Parasulfitobacter algicola]|uniref:DUF2927 domain-containing protein n=1 Tax=Parasulfitobacter algicola TaxID=2614809 RepID=A0ABX2IWH3_9RHOB|nr:DUF2927 domain-containing protein [Sulfitobacter algicola]NSX56396.1 DUF2927 domain-containing protein [Sulfitobacter algicola]